MFHNFSVPTYRCLSDTVIVIAGIISQTSGKLCQKDAVSVDLPDRLYICVSLPSKFGNSLAGLVWLFVNDVDSTLR